MAEISPKMAWPFPSAEENPWNDAFVDMINQMDRSAYASRSDRHIILAEGGTVSWSAPDLSWDDTLILTAPITGFHWQVLATSVQLDTDGQVLYVSLTRGPGSNTPLSPSVANTVPSDNNAIVVAARLGGRIYFRNGVKIESGDSIPGVGAGTGSPGSVADTRTAKIIVANSGNGDVVSNGDFLDSGNGEQLEAALAAASSGDDVYIRPGTYDLRAGSAVGPLTVPAGVRVWGAGREQVTVITKDSGDMSAFSLSDGAELWDVGIQVAVPVGAGSGTGGLVIMGTRSRSGRVKVDWQGVSYTGTEAGLLFMRAGFVVAPDTDDVRMIDLELIDLPSLRDLGTGDDLTAVNAVNGPDNRTAMVVRPVIEGGDIGVRISNRMHVADPSITNAFSRGIEFTESSGNLSGGIILNSSPDSSYQGVRVEDGVDKIMIDGVQVVATVAPVAGTRGIFLAGDRCSIRGCNIEGYEVGIEATAQSERNVVVGVVMSENTTPKTDAGTNNDFAHNVEA